MQILINFLTDDLIIPAGFYILGYFAIWFLAYGLARVFSNPTVLGSYDSGSAKAWKVSISFHIMAGTLLVFWLIYKAMNQDREMWHIPFYLLPYLFFITMDIFLLINFRQASPVSQKSKKTTRRRKGGRR